LAVQERGITRTIKSMLREASGEKLEETPAKEAGTRFPQFFSRFHAKLCM